MIRQRTLELCVSATAKMLQRRFEEAPIFNGRYRLTSAFALRTARPVDSVSGQGSSSVCAVRGGPGRDAAPPTRAPRASWRARDVGPNIQATSCCYRVVLGPQYPGYCGGEGVDARQTSDTKQYETSFAAGRARRSDNSGWIGLVQACRHFLSSKWHRFGRICYI